MAVTVKVTLVLTVTVIVTVVVELAVAVAVAVAGLPSQLTILTGRIRDSPLIIPRDLKWEIIIRT